MQVSIENVSSLERKMTIAVPADRIESQVTQRLKNAAKTARISGFRPGKVPLRVIRNYYGAGIRAEVLNDVMQKTFYEALTQEDVNPAGMPSIDTTQDESGKDLEFVASFEVYPEIALNDLEGLEVMRLSASVSDDDVEEMITTLQTQQTKYETVERAAVADDQLTIDYQGAIDGEAFDGGSADGSNLVLGSNSMIAGFEDGLIGASAEDEKVLALTFPDDYHNKELSGKAVQFAVKVNAVAESKKPELNEEFFKLYGVEEGGEEAFRIDVRNNMERELKQSVKNKVKNQVMDSLLERNSIDVPKSLIGQEIDRIRKQTLQQFGGGSNIDPSMFPAELFEDQANRRVSLGLLVAEYVKVNELKADGDEVRNMIEEMAQAYQDPEEVVKWYYNNEQQLSEIESVVLEEQVVTKMLETATVIDEEVSYKDAVKPDAPKQEAEEKSTEDGESE